MSNLEEDADYALDIVKGYVDQSEVNYESHKRGKNWTATVEFDPGAPGEIARDFWESNGRQVEVPENLRPGEVIEIAGDYYTGSGNKKPSRRYLRVLDVTENTLYLQKMDKPTKETIPADEWREENGYSNEGKFLVTLSEEDGTPFEELNPVEWPASKVDDRLPGVRTVLSTEGHKAVTVHEEEASIRVEMK